MSVITAPGLFPYRKRLDMYEQRHRYNLEHTREIIAGISPEKYKALKTALDKVINQHGWTRLVGQNEA